MKKSDFEKFAADQTSQHTAIDAQMRLNSDILVKLEPLADLVPYLIESAELKRSTERFVGNWKGRAKTATIFIGLIAVIITVVVSLRQLIIDLFYGQK